MSDPTTAIPADLPHVVDTLEFLPDAYRGQYRRDYDGKFRRAFVPVGDNAGFVANLDRIVRGEIMVLPEGVTPATLAAAAQAQEALQKEVLAETDRLTDKIVADRQAAIAARRAERISLNDKLRAAGQDPLPL